MENKCDVADHWLGNTAINTRLISPIRVTGGVVRPVNHPTTPYSYWEQVSVRNASSDRRHLAGRCRCGTSFTPISPNNRNSIKNPTQKLKFFLHFSSIVVDLLGFKKKIEVVSRWQCFKGSDTGNSYN